MPPDISRARRHEPEGAATGARRTVRTVALLTMMLGLLAVFAAPALAHAVVVSSNPPDGARLAAAPAQVSITFDETVSLGTGEYLHVTDETGVRVDTGAAVHLDGPTIAVKLRAGLGDGTYLLSYRVISADSHPVAGSTRFVVGNGALQELSEHTSAVNHVTSVVYDFVRWIGYAGAICLAGIWLPLTVWSRGRIESATRTLLWTGWGLTAVGTVAQLLLQGPYAAGLSPTAVLRPGLIDATLHSTLGTADCIRLLLLAWTAVTWSRLLYDQTRTQMAELCGLLMLGVVVSYTYAGHASAQHPQWAAVTSQSVHLLAVVVWLGGLVMLLAVTFRHATSGELRRVMPVFSRVGYVCVASIIGTGIYQSWLGVGSWSALWHTRYGQLVIAKAVLLALMLAVANFSRRVVQRQRAQAEFATGGLGRLVLGEAAAGVAVLAVTAVLVAQPPGRDAALAAYTRPTEVTISLAEPGVSTSRSAVLSVTPSHAGTVQITLRLSTPAIGVTGTALLAAKQLGPIELPLLATEPSTMFTASALLPAPGHWQFQFTVHFSEFDSVSASSTVVLH